MVLNAELIRRGALITARVEGDWAVPTHKKRAAHGAARKVMYNKCTERSDESRRIELESSWGEKYPAAIKSWRDHWDELATMYKYPEQIRRIIYSTNTIENFNR